MSRPVIVKRVPKSLSQKQIGSFFEEVRPLLEHDRPQLVFDLSLLRRIDAAGVELLLYCMKEAVGRDGDVKFASHSPQAQAVLELRLTGKLFEIFASTADAALSFSGYLPNLGRRLRPASELKGKSEKDAA